MRLSTEPDRDDARAEATLLRALEAGVRLFDTADCYAWDDADLHHNERLIAGALRRWSGERPQVATKVGIIRPKGAWVPCGKPEHLRRSAEESASALGVPTLDRLQLHVVDPKVSFRSTLQALRAIQDAGLAQEIGLSNVRLHELRAAQEIVPIRSVQVELSPLEDDAVRSGVVSYCLTQGIEVLAYRPFGGTKRAERLFREPWLSSVAERLGVHPSAVVLAWLESFGVVPLPGPSRPETAAHLAVRAGLSPEDLAVLDARYPWARLLRVDRAVRRPVHPRAEVVMVMGSPGSGKSRLAKELTLDGGVRLNRDERGGTLEALAVAMAEALQEGGARVVLDNTYGTRAQRSEVIEAAWREGGHVRCIHLDTPLEVCQRNAIARMLDRHGRLLEPDEIKAIGRKEPNTFGPSVLFRWRDSFEAPDLDEGFEAVERRTFVRMPDPDAQRGGVLVDLDALPAREGWDPGGLRAYLERHRDRWGDRTVMAQGWAPGVGSVQRDEIRASLLDGCPSLTDVALCIHGAGPPVCWCRKPLVGLALLLCWRHHLDPGRLLLVGEGAFDRAVARRLGAELVSVDLPLSD